MKINFLKPTDFRYERKFSISSLTKHEVEHVVRLHPAMFAEIFYERSVNNIYLDSYNLQSYFDNLDGVRKRLKVRIRWYGDLFGFVANPTLELKVKENNMGSKVLYALPGFTIDKGFSLSVIRGLFQQARLPKALKVELRNLDFSLLNSYSRKYFQSADKNFRLTIDSGLRFYRLSPIGNKFLHCKGDNTCIIIELKYAAGKDILARSVTNKFPFRLSKSSKYVAGVEGLNLW